MTEKTVCNRENGSTSDPNNRQCWITDGAVSLVQSHLDYLAQKYAPKLQVDTDPNSPFWEMVRDLHYYCDTLRVRNGLREPSVLNRDEKWPDELDVTA